MERQWLNLDQIKAEYASNDYNPELLLQHLLHHVESSPASVPEVTDGMAIAFHNALTDGAIGQAEVDEIKTGLRAALAAAPTPPVSEDKDKIIAAANALENIASTSSSTRIRRVANEALKAIRARRN